MKHIFNKRGNVRINVMFGRDRENTRIAAVEKQ